MSDGWRCPTCGTELSGDAAAETEAAAVGAGVIENWSTIDGRVHRPPTVAEVLAGTAPPPPTWWLPTLAYLAYPGASEQAKAVLDEFASRRDELSYAVVEEQTDGVVGLSVQPWPYVDGHGRLRFPIDEDPAQVEVEATGLLSLLRAARQQWQMLGLLEQELVERAPQVGDAYGLILTETHEGHCVPALREHDEPARYLRGLLQDRVGEFAVPVVDVTWDAREAGKLAHYAAVAGAVEAEPDPAMAAVVQETEARYVTGYLTNTDPRDVEVPPEARA